MTNPAYIPYEAYTFSEEEMKMRAHALFEFMDHRRTVRDFSDRPIPGEILEQIIRIANTAPSGANKQPWTFCLVTDPLIKQKIRMAAEAEEYENYHGRMSEEWLDDLAHLGTDWKKPFLEIAPALIVVFRKAYDVVDGKKKKNYYVQESVGLACGFLLAAIHHVGLVTLTHTPSPMNFLQEILGRPDHEKPFLLIPVAFPAPNVMVPNIHRKNLDEVLFYY